MYHGYVCVVLCVEPVLEVEGEERGKNDYWKAQENQV